MQWLSGLKQVERRRLRPTQPCGGEQSKRKSIDFRLLVHSLFFYREVNHFQFEYKLVIMLVRENA